MSKRPSKLTRREEFLQVAASRRRWAAPGLVLQAAPSASERIRVGFTASRKVGGAVERNRAKRRLRALAREILPAHGQSGIDYVLVGRAASVERPYDAMRRDLETALRRLGHWRDGVAVDPAGGNAGAKE